MNRFKYYSSPAELAAQPIAETSLLDYAVVLADSEEAVDFYIYLPRDIANIGTPYYILPDDDSAGDFMWAMRPFTRSTESATPYLIEAPDAATAAANVPYQWEVLDSTLYYHDAWWESTGVSAYGTVSLHIEPALDLLISWHNNKTELFTLSKFASDPANIFDVAIDHTLDVDDIQPILADNKLFFIGDTSGQYIDLSLKTLGSGKQMAPAGGIRYGFGGVYNNKIYMVARNTADVQYPELQIYDIALDSWSVGATLSSLPSYWIELYSYPSTPIVSGNQMAYYRVYGYDTYLINLDTGALTIQDNTGTTAQGNTCWKEFNVLYKFSEVGDNPYTVYEHDCATDVETPLTARGFYVDASNPIVLYDGYLYCSTIMWPHGTTLGRLDLHNALLTTDGTMISVTPKWDMIDL